MGDTLENRLDESEFSTYFKPHVKIISYIVK